MIVAAAVDHRGFIKVDEVDGRSPVERAAATFVPDPRRQLGRSLPLAVSKRALR